jgi:hypothetical protein
MRPSSVLRVARLELRRAARDAYTWIGVAAFLLIAGAGAYFYWRSVPPRPAGARLFNEAYLLALVAAYQCGFARDRMCGFDRYQVANFEQPAAFYAGHLLSAMVFLLSFALLSFGYALVLALGDAGFAAEHALRMFYISVIMLPFVVLLELALSSRMPVPILLIAFFLVVLVYSRMGDVNEFSATLGLAETSALGAVVRALLALLLSAAWYPLFLKRLGRVSLASR